MALLSGTGILFLFFRMKASSPYFLYFSSQLHTVPKAGIPCFTATSRTEKQSSTTSFTTVSFNSADSVLFTRKYAYPMFPIGISPFLTVQGLIPYILATDFRLNSPSRYFSDTTFLNSNENFSMHPQFLVWCLTFGAQFKNDGHYFCRAGGTDQTV